MNKTVVIVGSEGQDGKIAFDFFVEKGYNVVGLDRKVVRTHGGQWETEVDIADKKSVFELLKKVQPDEIYYFAAFHHSSEDKAIDEIELFERSYSVHVSSYLYFLEGIHLHSTKTRIFYAASSLIFGESDTEIQNELTPFRPNSVYGITKLDGLMMSRYYREKYSVFAAVGIFYNHESEYRSGKFISMKIVEAAVNIKKGAQEELIVGDSSAKVDWGYAPDYVDAAYQMLQLERADDYIIASGKEHSIQDFISLAFEYVGLEWSEYVKEDASLLTRRRKTMIGNAEKLRKATGWKPRTEFREMIRKMVDSKMGKQEL